MRIASPTQVICIASGKGGVGKTVVAVNLAVALHRNGKRVMLLDCDLDMANAHIALGEYCEHNLSHFLSGEKTLQDIAVTTRSGIRLVPGASGLKFTANISQLQAASIIQAFSTLEEELDYLIVDLSSGISPATIAFMVACQRRYIVVRNDPLSIADAFATMKILMQDFGMTELYLLPNGMNSQADGKLLFDRIDRACGHFMFRSINYMSTIEKDTNILLALKKCESVIDSAPSSLGAGDFRRLASLTEALEPIIYASGVLEFFIERLVSGSNIHSNVESLQDTLVVSRQIH